MRDPGYGPEILDLSEEEIRAALDHDPAAVQREFHSCLLTTMILAADLCGLAEAEADAAIGRQHQALTGADADPTVIHAVRDNPAIDEKRLLEELRGLREQLNDPGKTMVLEAAWGVAGDGEHRELVAFSHRLGQALELSTDQVQAFVRDTSAQADTAT